MKAKPVIPRRQADDDAAKAADFYLDEAGVNIALAFIESVEQVFNYISRHPAAGSPSYAERLDVPGLRFWKTKRFPYLIFYVDRGTHVEVWRILHEKMDIPAWMRDENP